MLNPTRATQRSWWTLGLLLLALSPGLPAQEETVVDWGYAGPTGPDHWGQLHPTYADCAAGTRQSPIDIVESQRTAYTPLRFQYRSHAFEALNTGRAVRLVIPPGSALLVRGQAYELEALQFHVPGEHRFGGGTPAAEIQFVHRDQRGELTIVAVPMDVGERDNRMLDRILEHLPERPGERVRMRQVGVNPLFLLPVERSYYSYVGSLTAPPCTEPVQWYLLREPLEIGPGQLQRLARATRDNARPVQPQNGRVVQSHLRF